MIRSLAPRFQKLLRAQRLLWPQLGPSVTLGFVLYGGAAVSLHLGHRRSVDFDFFTDRPLDPAAIRRGFGFAGSAKMPQQTKDTLVLLASGVKLSFFGGLRFGRVGDPHLTTDGVAEVASLEDQMAHKLEVIHQRAEKKNYQDIAAMLRAGLSFSRGLAAARLFFGAAFQPAEGLKALTYFKDGDLTRLSRDDQRTLIAAAASVGDLSPVARRSQRLAIPL